MANIPQTADDYRAGGVSYRIAGPADEAIIKSVLRRTPVKSWITLSTEYEPDYFAAKDLFGHKETIIARSTDDAADTVGMCAYMEMPVYFNGEPVLAGYLGELRVLAPYRHKLSVIKNGFSSVKALSNRRHKLACWYTSIAKENGPARRLLEANLKDMPRYTPQGGMISMALAAKPYRHAVVMQAAQTSDIPVLADFYNNRARQYQYAPVLTEDWLRKLDGAQGLRLEDFYLLKEGKTIRACFALWDQRNIKQTVVRGYRFPMNILRYPYNGLARLSGRVVLPPIGEQIDYLFIAFLAMDDSIQPEFKNVVTTALSLTTLRHARVAMLGLSAQNPIRFELDGFAKQTYHTCIEAVTWPSDAVTEETLVAEGNRIVQPEIALL